MVLFSNHCFFARTQWGQTRFEFAFESNVLNESNVLRFTGRGAVYLKKRNRSKPPNTNQKTAPVLNEYRSARVSDDLGRQSPPVVP